jgi:glycolate oxidase iron-sulfur subunit
MQTQFSDSQLENPALAHASEVLRNCVHCGFCLATCPTYQILGDERDSPRGRIYLIKDMLEEGRPADDATVRHLDRCLSCLSCMTTCPSGVDYMHLVDHARAYIEETHERPWVDRQLRRVLSFVMPRPSIFRMALVAAQFPALLGPLVPGRLGAMLKLARRVIHAPSWLDRPQRIAATGSTKRRVALLTGCVQQVLAAEINEATVRLLTRLGCEVHIVKDLGCCGALSLHLGDEAGAIDHARRNTAALAPLIAEKAIDAVVVNASGCGTTLKDYGFLLRADAEYADTAKELSAMARDVTEVLGEIGLDGHQSEMRLSVAYHSACSLQHGQRVTEQPQALLASAGFDVRAVPDGHLCCGSAGTYNIMQPKLATGLRDRKVENIASTGAQVIAAGNIGCMVQIGTASHAPIVHTVELLDWATGGPKPPALVERQLDA